MSFQEHVLAFPRSFSRADPVDKTEITLRTCHRCLESLVKNEKRTHVDE